VKRALHMFVLNESFIKLDMFSGLYRKYLVLNFKKMPMYYLLLMFTYVYMLLIPFRWH